jgi:acyl-CoA thioester hydrolase
MQRASLSEPPVILRTVVEPSWIDRNGHFNAGYYAVVFDQALVPWYDGFGITTEYRTRLGVTTFTAETHIAYLREVREGAAIVVSAQLLDFDSKRIHSFFRMRHAGEGFLAATCEILSLFVDARERRVTAMPAELAARLEETRRRHAEHQRPAQAGRSIALAARAPARE